MDLAKVLEKLSNACGVAGREEEVRELMNDLLKPYVDEIKEDKLGNVIGIKKGNKNGPTIMLAAHMDEIGLTPLASIGAGGFQSTMTRSLSLPG